jgi:PleD family two-component response regulator
MTLRWASSLDLRDLGCESLQKPGQPALKILVVDDEVAILERLDKLLSSLGRGVRTFAACSTRTAPKSH